MLICIGILCRGVETLKSALLVNFPLFPRIIILDIIVHITSTSPPLSDDRQFQFKIPSRARGCIELSFISSFRHEQFI